MEASEKLTYSVAEAAKALGVSEWSVRKAVNAGDLPKVPAYFGDRILIPRRALEEQINAAAS